MTPSAIDDTAFELFIKSALSDDDMGYPPDARFVPEDMPEADTVVWHSLHDEQRAVVIVTGAGIELLVAPCERPRPLRWLDNARGRIWVYVGWRDHALAPYSVRTSVGRHPLSDMRRSPAVACS